MKTQRELLELAATAAGVPLSRLENETVWDTGHITRRGWNPLTDDGDALRLAVKLGLHVSARTVEVWRQGKQIAYLFEDDDDHCAATRLAITRAAAAIGEAMP